MDKFKVGMKVQWSSQAGGFSKVKHGVIKFVVPSDQVPAEVLRDTNFHCDAGLIPRGHESYLVQVGKSVNLSWPRVTHLVNER